MFLKYRLLLSTSLIVVVGALGEARAQRADRATKRATSPVASKANPASARGLTVLDARFGADKRWIEVTDFLRDAIKDDQINYNARGLPDIAYGTNKSLAIVYMINGKVGLSITRADVVASISLQDEAKTVPVPKKGLAILAAHYGITDKWEDVTAALRRKVSRDRLLLASPSRAGLPDPAVGAPKALLVAYAVNGRVAFSVREDDRAVALPETRRSNADGVLVMPVKADFEYLKPWVDEPHLGKVSDLLSIQSLDLRGRPVKDADMVHLRGLSNLRSLVIDSPEVGNAGLKSLAGLSKLGTLHLVKTSVTDPGMSTLAGMGQLRTLNLYRNKVTNAGLAQLKTLHDLEYLAIFGTQVDGSGLSVLKAMPKLKTLKIGNDSTLAHSMINDSALVHLEGLNDLESLGLYGCAVRGPGLRHLKDLPALSDLDLSETRVNDEALARLLEFPSLTKLKLNDTAVSNAGMATLKQMTKLNTLELEATKVEDAGLADLMDLKNLEDLHLCRSKISDAGLAHVGQMTSLVSLSLVRTGIRGDGLAHLKNLAKLQKLDLDSTEIDDAKLRFLTPLTSLVYLELFGSKITDAGLVHLKPLRELKNLLLRRTEVTDEGVANLKKALPNLEIWRYE